jgi:hypothetical protein
MREEPFLNDRLKLATGHALRYVDKREVLSIVSGIGDIRSTPGVWRSSFFLPTKQVVA